MKIDPANTGPRPHSTPGKLGEAAPTPAARTGSTPGPEPVALPVDRIELSSAARELQDLASTTGDAATAIPHERLREILGRLTEGFYERPEVRQEVLRRLAGDLGIKPDR